LNRSHENIPNYYVVSSINDAGESANSNQVSGIPGPQPSTTTLVSSPAATGPYGTSVTFTAAVTTGATGTVTFRDGSTVLGTGTLSAGSATFATSALAVADHSITANYDGDTTFAGSISAPSAYLVTAKALTITGVTAPNKEYDGTGTADLTSGALAGVISGDTVTITPGTGAFASPNTGTWAVTATGFALGGANAGNYTLAAQPTVPNATITARPLVLTGTRVYDGTDLVAAAGLTISNKVGADDLTLTGAVSLTGKDAGSHGFSSGSVAPVLVGNAATGNTGAIAAASFTVNVVSPVIGNTLIAVMTTRGYSANRVSSISQTGVTWTKALGAEGINTNATSGSTTEIWIGSNIIAGAGTVATINFPAATTLRAAAVIAEYSGLLAVSPLDKTAGSSGNNTTASTGTTAATTQTNELWIGGIGLRDSTYTLGTPTNAFAQVTSANSTSTTTNTNAKAYFLEKIVATTATAGTSGTITSSRWSGAIATFKAASLMNLTLSGTAAANYTLTGLTGSVTITPKALTLTATPAVTAKTYNGLTAATLTGPALLVPESPGTGTPSDGTPYAGDTVAVTLSGAFDTKDAAAGKAVTSTSTLGGANAGNYTLTQPVGVTGAILPADLTITADDQSKTYGQTLAFGSGATQFTSSGLLDGEMIGSVTMTCGGGDAAAAVASYPIMPSAATGGTFSVDNYSISYASGTLTLNKASQTITFGPLADRTHGDAPFWLTATTDSGLAVSYSSSDPTVAGVSGNTVTILKAGATTLTASQAGDDNHHAATPVGQTLNVNPAQTPFEAWAAAPAQGLTAGVDDGPLDDPDHDGFSNLMEFVLGGAPMGSSQAIRPKLTQVAGHWVFAYDRSHLSKASTTQVVEYGSDLTGWTPLTIPADSSGIVTITPGPSSDHVEVSIPPQGANGFARLKVSQ
jgi:hypothetical protein